MGRDKLTDHFKRDAVAQITGRGDRQGGFRAAEIRRLKRELIRVSEQRDILKRGEPLSVIGPRTMASAYFAREAR